MRRLIILPAIETEGVLAGRLQLRELRSAYGDLLADVYLGTVKFVFVHNRVSFRL